MRTLMGLVLAIGLVGCIDEPEEGSVTQGVTTCEFVHARNARLANSSSITIDISPADGRFETSFLGPLENHRRLRVTTTIEWLVCRADGVDLVDFGGTATVNHRPGYPFLVSLQNFAPGQSDYYHVVIGNPDLTTFFETMGFTQQLDAIQVELQ